MGAEHFRMRKRYIAVGGTWVPAEEFQAEPQTHHVMPDIQPYQAMAVDVATGVAPVIKSRSEHREYLKRNGLLEIGNEVEAHLKQRERKELPKDPRLKQRLIEVAQKHRFYN